MRHSSEYEIYARYIYCHKLLVLYDSRMIEGLLLDHFQARGGLAPECYTTFCATIIEPIIGKSKSTEVYPIRSQGSIR